MLVKIFHDALKETLGTEFYTGVPDSLLKPLCDYLIDSYGLCDNHIITVNEGNAVAIASGYHLATGKTPCIYLQNSGIGNIVNPVSSLTSKDVYGIGCVYVIGWRGEPDVPDEPQHVFQGKTTLEMLDVLDISYSIVDKNYTQEMLEKTLTSYSGLVKNGKSVAFVIKKGGLSNSEKTSYKNANTLKREEIIETIVSNYAEDIFVCTTGKTSREMFELREKHNHSHGNDFLTVGSMGHSSAIALGIALNKEHKRIWCIDGDGAALMHMGAMATIAAQKPKNIVHVVINNMSHESVGGQPTAAGVVDIVGVAKACGYSYAKSAKDMVELLALLNEVTDKEGPIFIEVKSAIGSRDDLGRPTSSPTENKLMFMKTLSENKNIQEV